MGRCLAALPDVVLLSELNPANRYGADALVSKALPARRHCCPTAVGGGAWPGPWPPGGDSPAAPGRQR
ncbi:hypothetical protein [Cyanobium sp. N5-Cardenillas]|uniref:hypothetical protein n=1 Tax=Cyanobium sp. N5-Cardenillas TaxID=2823720 RepID=UPI0020CBAF74|nr:hypothetical protein [Cyanobium sp. N5-Cardenillas]MCP9785155.1 hypothetical protein [Cyanobium sp. N5-Cardenillas]